MKRPRHTLRLGPWSKVFAVDVRRPLVCRADDIVDVGVAFEPNNLVAFVSHETVSQALDSGTAGREPAVFGFGCTLPDGRVYVLSVCPDERNELRNEFDSQDSPQETGAVTTRIIDYSLRTAYTASVYFPK